MKKPYPDYFAKNKEAFLRVLGMRAGRHNTDNPIDIERVRLTNPNINDWLLEAIDAIIESDDEFSKYIIFDDSAREFLTTNAETQKWLKEHDIPISKLFEKNITLEKLKHIKYERTLS
jgi:predicted nucleotide-binding protein (sugar kinase/HSP70/actin superfamily)